MRIPPKFSGPFSLRFRIARWLVLGGACCAIGVTWMQAEDEGDPEAAVLETPDLVTLWTFSEPAGSPRIGKGSHSAELIEANGPVERADSGVFGPHSLRIREGQWLKVPREKLGPLDIHGPEAEVSLLVWFRRDARRHWQSLAGVWDETHEKRQYMLFLNARSRTNSTTLKREECDDFLHGHVSAVGGPTPGHEFCFTYASGGTAVGFEKWHLATMTYDGEFSRIYLDGVLDEAKNYNPFPYADGLFDGGEDGAPFTVGANHVAGKENNNPFGGWIAGVAVFERALSDDEIARIAEKTLETKE